MMVLAEPFSAFFWSCYCLGGISDLLDGFAARKLNLQSDAGARLDSIADLVFAAAIAVVAIRSILFPGWLWLCICGIALLKFAGYVIGLGLTAAGALLCAAAFVSSLEEVMITARSKELNRDCRGLLVRGKKRG